MKVFRASTFAIVVLVLMCGVASAQDWGKVMTPDRPLNVRAGRSLNTERVTTIMPGELVRMDFSKGDWSAVFPLSVTSREESAAIGYVKTKYMQPGNIPDTADWGTLVAPKGKLNIRQKRDRRSEHMLTLDEGEVVKIDFEKDEWVAVFRPNETVRDEGRALGYANSKYLFPATKKQVASVAAAKKPKVEPKPAPIPPKKAMPIQAEPAASHGGSVVAKVKPQPIVPEAKKPSPQMSPADEDLGWGQVVTLKRRANVRSSRTAGSTLVATLDSGARVRVDFLEKGWYAVFRLSETKRDQRNAMGYIYAPLIEEPALELNVHPLDKKDALDMQSPPAAEQAPVMMSESDAMETHPKPMPPEAGTPAEVATLNGKDYMTITPQDQGNLPNKGPVPRADKVRHGFKYGIIERTAGSNAASGKLLLKVYVDLSVVPSDATLRDFAKTIYNDEFGDAKEMLLMLYLPGQDTKDLAYGQAKFDRTGLLEFWTRRSTLYGTPLLP